MKVALFEPWPMDELFAHFVYLPSYGLVRLAGLHPGTVVVNGPALGEEATLAVLEDGFDVVGVSAQTANRNQAAVILEEAKEGGSVTVVGGHHPTADPDFFADLPYVDFVVRGQGEGWWQSILEGGDVPRVTPLDHGDHPDNYPIADWSGVTPDPFAMPYYKPDVTPLHVATSYGCTGRCIYCLSRTMHGGKVKRRDVRLVVEELTPLYERGARRFYVIDECFGGDRAHALAVSRAFGERFPEMTWSTFGRADLLDRDLLVAMKAGGCYALIVGMESGDQEMLRRLGKGYVDVRSYPTLVGWCREIGIRLSTQFLFGLPFETEGHVALTNQLVADLGLYPETLGHIIVMPGMPLHEMCVEAGLLDSSFWDGNEPYFTFPPGGLEWVEDA